MCGWGRHGGGEWVGMMKYENILVVVGMGGWRWNTGCFFYWYQITITNKKTMNRALAMRSFVNDQN